MFSISNVDYFFSLTVHPYYRQTDEERKMRIRIFFDNSWWEGEVQRSGYEVIETPQSPIYIPNW